MGQPSEQQVLDTALAWAVMNNHLEIADFLLGHGADINTNWCSHEAAITALSGESRRIVASFVVKRGTKVSSRTSVVVTTVATC